VGPHDEGFKSINTKHNFRIHNGLTLYEILHCNRPYCEDLWTTYLGGKKGYYAATLQRSVILEALPHIKSVAGQHNVHLRLITSYKLNILTQAPE
jgi:hypothetical protein